MITTPIAHDIPVGELAARYPLATRVLARHHIDFCCGGGRPLDDVCRMQDLDVATVLQEINSEIDSGNGFRESIPGAVWTEAPPADLIDHILGRYHASLREELPRLEGMTRKVARVHHDKDPERLERLLETFLSLKAELETHMLKEEHVLFPMIREGVGRHADAPIAMMVQEHTEAGDLLRTIRALTNDYTAPDEACNTWRALWAGLEALEADMHEHIHLENNILFPRALAGA